VVGKNQLVNYEELTFLTNCNWYG